MPAITVLMAVRNGEPYLQAAVESILNQTYGDFEFLIVDDLSTDNTREIIRGYNDRRIRLLSLERNVGQTAALNRGLHEVTTDWVARMDADDFSAPLRLERQMATLQSDSSIGCVGTFAWTFTDDPSKSDSVMKRPVGHDAIMSALLWSAPIIHGSIIASTRTMKEAGGYNERYRYSADLDLYDRLLRRCRSANVPEPLLGIRRHPGQDSHSTKAILETVEILNLRISSGLYAPADLSVVRAARHLHEALCAKIESRIPATIDHVARAFWFSPSLTLRHFDPRRFLR